MSAIIGPAGWMSGPARPHLARGPEFADPWLSSGHGNVIFVTSPRLVKLARLQRDATALGALGVVVRACTRCEYHS